MLIKWVLGAMRSLWKKAYHRVTLYSTLGVYQASNTSGFPKALETYVKGPLHQRTGAFVSVGLNCKLTYLFQVLFLNNPDVHDTKGPHQPACLENLHLLACTTESVLKAVEKKLLWLPPTYLDAIAPYFWVLGEKTSSCYMNFII